MTRSRNRRNRRHNYYSYTRTKTPTTVRKEQIIKKEIFTGAMGPKMVAVIEAEEISGGELTHD